MIKREKRMQIVYALEKLVQTKNLADITVKDVCKLSGVPRSTFYFYFCDIYSVPQWVWDDMMSTTLYRIGAGVTWDEGHRYMFNNILKHKALFTKIYWENDNNSILEYGYRGGYAAIKRNVEVYKKHHWTKDELLELDYTVRALASLTTKWGRDGMIVPVEKMVYIFSTHIPPFLKELCDTKVAVTEFSSMR